MVIESGVLTGDQFLVAFRERAKELSCLYTVEELFERPGITLPGIIRGIVEAIPGGWKYPEVCRASVSYGGVLYHQPDFVETPWAMHSTIVSHGNVVGKISVYYVRERPAADEGPFLKEERRLIDAIADRIGRRVLYEKLKDVFDSHPSGPGSAPPWRSILDLLQSTDISLFMRMSRKMLTLLSTTGDAEAGDLLARYHLMFAGAQQTLSPDANAPLRMRQETISPEITDEIFRMAEKHYGNAGILGRIQKWVMEDRSAFLVKILEDPGHRSRRSTRPWTGTSASPRPRGRRCRRRSGGTASRSSGGS